MKRRAAVSRENAVLCCPLVVALLETYTLKKKKLLIKVTLGHCAKTVNQQYSIF